MKWLTKMVWSSSFSHAKSLASILGPVPRTCEPSGFAGWQSGSREAEGGEWAKKGWTKCKAGPGKQQHYLSLTDSSRKDEPSVKLARVSSSIIFQSLTALLRSTVVVLLSSHSVVSDSCNPTDCSMPGFPVLHCLLEFAQIHVHWVSDAIWPSHPLQL